MKRLVFLFLILGIGIILFGDPNVYNFIDLGHIDIGMEEGSMGWDTARLSSGGIPGPHVFNISSDGLLYIADPVTHRISIFNSDLTFERNIEDIHNMNIGFAKKIDIQDSILVYLGSKGLIKFDEAGNKIYELKARLLPKSIKQYYDYFYKNEYVFYYDNRKKVRCIDPEGIVLSNEESLEVLEGLNKELGVFNDFQRITRHFSHSNLILIGDFYFSDTAHNFKEYLLTAYGIRSFSGKSFIQDLDIYPDLKYLGFDKEFNIYFGGVDWNTEKRFINIYNTSGQRIDAFYYDQLERDDDIRSLRVIPAIAPNGDVYFMRSDETGHHFWKLERKW